jgi:hypothetical protein
MAHNMVWLETHPVLLVQYQGPQNEETLRECMDDIVTAVNICSTPVAVLIDWRGVAYCELKALLKLRGHAAYKHPMAAREVLVGMDILSRFENEISAVKTRSAKITRYYDTMDEAMNNLDEMLAGVPV